MEITEIFVYSENIFNHAHETSYFKLKLIITALILIMCASKVLKHGS